MQKIPLNLAKPGMVLARAVSRDNGITIVAEGVELSESLLKRLEGMGIERVVVKGSPVTMDGGGSTAFDERLARLDHLFRAQEKDQWMRKVKAFLRNYFKLKAAAQAAAQTVETVDSAQGENVAANGPQANGIATTKAKG
ncbi:MAG: hypothetical protein V3573_03085 [Desulfovibrionaceae bacterium]